MHRLLGRIESQYSQLQSTGTGSRLSPIDPVVLPSISEINRAYSSLWINNIDTMLEDREPTKIEWWEWIGIVYLSVAAIPFVLLLILLGFVRRVFEGADRW